VTGPLAGIKVLDLSTLVPGPLASLILAEAGADVLKVERPGMGDEMRTYVPRLGDASTNFALLNRGKRTVTLDLKDDADRGRALDLAADADVVIEQFRPGVLDRLGLGYAVIAERNPRIVLCSISGFGQSGPSAHRAAHDLNYLADAGILSVTEPALPQVLIADIAGGAYPAVMNILMALRQRDVTGHGVHLDVAMSDNVSTLMYWALGEGFAEGRWPAPGSGLVTGGSPRYRLYRTADGATLAAAPLEDRFWSRFCELIDLPEGLRDDQRAPESTTEAVAALIAARTAEHWAAVFEGEDVCCSFVRGLDDAVQDPHVVERGLFDATVTDGDQEIPALPVPLAPVWRNADRRAYPAQAPVGGAASWLDAPA
jgi:crotonobetainyl-CoA:carnitine CoA-transferase CaiB-like acyl-CoA transferase